MLGRSSRGFTLIELMVAVGIAAIVGFVLLNMTASALRWTGVQAQRDAEHAAIDALVDGWRVEEDSAWAIFTPATDVKGTSNADGHEIDFFTRDAKSNSYFWAYDYDAVSKTLTRYRYSAPGGSPTVDRTYGGITAFFAQTYPVSALQDPTSKIYSPLYTGASLTPGGVRFYGPANPLIAGGNQITYVRVEGPSMVREMNLATQSAPAGYTVVLTYTPAPSPSATPSQLQVWPPAVRYAQQGTQIAGGCIAVAYADAGFTTRLPAGSSDPWGAGYAVDPSGCYNGAVVVHEAGYNGWIADSTGSTCSGYIEAGKWSSVQNGSPVGPTTAQSFSGGTNLTVGCALSFKDTRNDLASTQAQVVAPCWEVGGSCSFSETWPNDNPSCVAPNDDPGGMSPGYDGTGGFTMSPSNLGSLVVSGGGGSASATFTRTAAGPVTISAYATYESWSYTNKNGQFSCRSLKTRNTIQTWTVQSV